MMIRQLASSAIFRGLRISPIMLYSRNPLIKGITQIQNRAKDMERAIASVAIIKLIATARAEDMRSPLLEQLLKLQSHLVSREVMREMQKLFTEGININTSIFNQQRITNPIQQSRNQTFSFFPNTCVTSPMFRQFILRSVTKTLLYGPYGISKTTSIMLFWTLSDIVNKFLIQAYPSALEDFKNVIEKQGLSQFVPKKLFYWSIDFQNQKLIKKILRMQCEEFQFDETEFESQSLSDLVQSISKQIRKKKIKADIVFDQINALASLYRKQNQRILEKKERSDNLFQMALRAKGYLKDLQIMSLQTGGRVYYNTSINIQQQILGKPSRRFPVTLEINGHTDAKMLKISYLSNFYTPINQAQIKLFFSLELLKAFKKKKISLFFSKQEEFVSYVRQKLENQKLNHIVRPYIIFKVVQQMIKYTTQIQSLQKLDQFLSDVLQKFKNEFQEQFETEIQRYLQKPIQQSLQNKRILMLHAVFFYAQRKFGRYNNGKIEIPFKEIEIGFSMEQELLEENLFEVDANKKVIIFYGFQNISEKFITKFRKKVLQPEIMRLLDSIFYQKWSAFDQLIEHFFIDVVFQSKGQFKIKTSREAFQIKQKCTFIDFGSNNNSISNLEKIISILNQPSNNQPQKQSQKSVFAVPVEQFEPSQTGSTFDFLIGRVHPQQKETLQIYSFDFATSEQQDAIKKKYKAQKLSKMFEELNKQLPQSNYSQIFQKINWSHSVVCIPEIYNAKKTIWHQQQFSPLNNAKLVRGLVSFEDMKIIPQNGYFKSNTSYECARGLILKQYKKVAEAKKEKKGKATEKKTGKVKEKTS